MFETVFNPNYSRALGSWQNVDEILKEALAHAQTVHASASNESVASSDTDPESASSSSSKVIPVMNSREAPELPEIHVQDDNKQLIFLHPPSNLRSSSDDMVPKKDEENKGILPGQRKRSVPPNPIPNGGIPVLVETKKVKTCACPPHGTGPGTGNPPGGRLQGKYGIDAAGGGDAAKNPNPAIILSDDKMFTVPPLQELNEQVAKTGNYMFFGLHVGHRDHGEVHFIGFRDLKQLAAGEKEEPIDLSKHVVFRHGGVELQPETGTLQRGPKVIILLGLTREEFGRQFKMEVMPTDEEMLEILAVLMKSMDAIFTQFNEERGLWSFLVFPSSSD